MLEECKGLHNWFNCLSCGLLSTHLCPLEGDDVLDKIANRIKMMEDPSYEGFKKEISNHK